MLARHADAFWALISPLLPFVVQGLAAPADTALRLPSLRSIDAEGLSLLPDPQELDSWLQFSPPGRATTQGVGPSADARRGGAGQGGFGLSSPPSVPHPLTPGVTTTFSGVEVSQCTSRGSIAALWATMPPGPAGPLPIFSGTPIKAAQLVPVASTGSMHSLEDSIPTTLRPSPDLQRRSASATTPAASPRQSPLAGLMASRLGFPDQNSLRTV